MKATNHQVVHQYQPTPTSCSQTALAILLSHYDKKPTVEHLLKSIPQTKDEAGNDTGSINQQLATWCIDQGFSVTMYSFDCQIIDQSWSDLPSNKVIARLQAAIDGYEVPALGKTWSNGYRQAYIEYLEAGGTLHIQPYVTSQLLYDLLQHGPLLPVVCYNTMYAASRSSLTGEFDDIHGHATNHSIVITGYNDDGNFLIADPIRKPGHHTIEPERLIAAISTAQIECDNLLFQIS